MNNSQKCLSEKTCLPCRGGVPPLSKAEIKELLPRVGDDWIINEMGHLYKEFRYENFIQAWHFASQIARIAQDEMHHPDLKIGYGYCAVELWTHKINALTEADFIMAAKIELKS